MTMHRELYFDISSEDHGGSLYRVTDVGGHQSFLYQHSVVAPDDSITVHETRYADFESFWQTLATERWHFMHPLFVHPEQRAFIQAQLATVNWNSGSQKWQASHQRQWTKVLTATTPSYTPPQR